MKISRRTFLKTLAAGSVTTAISGIGSWGYVTEIEPDWIEITQVRLTLPRLDPAFNGYRIAQISDIHIDTWLGGERLENIVHLINQQQPDLVTITGDFVTHSLRYNADMITALRQLTPPDGTAAVLGNHDYWTDAPAIRQVIQRSSLVDVNNNVHVIQRGDARLHIGGVDDVMEGKSKLSQVLNRLPEQGAAILLAHEPDYADRSSVSGRIDLQISGHSHGGQVNLPIIGRPVLPSLGRKYPAGLYRVGEMYQYTNRGIGMVFPAVRLNCRPEITIFTLQSPI